MRRRATGQIDPKQGRRYIGSNKKPTKLFGAKLKRINIVVLVVLLLLLLIHLDLSFLGQSNGTKDVANDVAPPSSLLKQVECSDSGVNRVPHFIIAGAQKGGTSALLEILSEHGHLLPASVLYPRTREVHFFDKLVTLDKPLLQYSEAEICRWREQYSAKWDANIPPHWLSYEKTPEYLPAPHVPALVKLICPWVKIIAILRNPVERAHSHYKHRAGKHYKFSDSNLPYPSFEQVIDTEIEHLQSINVTKAPLLADYSPNQTHYDWGRPLPLEDETYQYADSLLFDGILYRGIYSEQIARYKQYFELGVNLKVVHYEMFKADQEAVVNDVFDFIGAESIPLEDDVFRFNYHEAKSEHVMADRTRAYLTEFFKPYNEELRRVLGEDHYYHYH